MDFKSIGTDLLTNAAWAIVVALVAFVASYAVFGERINEITIRVTNLENEVAAQTDQNNQINIQLATINTNLEYIKTAIANLQGNH